MIVTMKRQEQITNLMTTALKSFKTNRDRNVGLETAMFGIPKYNRYLPINLEKSRKTLINAVSTDKQRDEKPLSILSENHYHSL